PAEVRDEVDELLALLDVLLHRRGIGRLELAGGAAAPDLDLAVLEALPHLLALLLAERRFDAVLVPGAQLDRRDADVLAHLDEGRHVPRLADVVRDGAEPELE